MFEEVTSIFSNQFCFFFLVLMSHFGACRDNYAGHVHKNIFFLCNGNHMTTLRISPLYKYCYSLAYWIIQIV